MADAPKTPPPTSKAIIPMGSQLDDPVAAGAATQSDDPFANPSWLGGVDGVQPKMDADPTTPGVDVFGSNMNDVAGGAIPVPGAAQGGYTAPQTPGVPNAAPADISASGASTAPSVGHTMPAADLLSGTVDTAASAGSPDSAIPIAPANTQPLPTAAIPAQAAVDPDFNPNSPFNDFPLDKAAPAGTLAGLSSGGESADSGQATPVDAFETVSPTSAPLNMPPVIPVNIPPPLPVTPTLDAGTLAAAALAEPPEQKALNKLVDQVVSPKTRRNILLVIIFILLVLVVILASAVLYFMVKGPVAVTIGDLGGTQSSSTSTTTSTSSTTSAATTSSVAANGPALIAYFVVKGNELSPGEEDNFPADTIKFGEDYFIPVELGTATTTDVAVQEALNALFKIKTARYTDAEYDNFLSRATLTASTSQQGDAESELVVDLQGNFVVASTADISFAKQQIERTIENYVFNYKVTLNGSEADYICLGDEGSAECAAAKAN